MPSINIIARDNGVGLSCDLRLLASRLRARDFEVTLTRVHGGKLTKWLRPPSKRLQWRLRKPQRPCYDINLMLEHVWPDDLPFARRNVLVPNPEWFLPRDRRHLPAIDLILAKTRHAERIFGQLGTPVVYTGFTGHNRFDPNLPRRKAFFHLAGRSNFKGTERLLSLWRRHPEWPLLTVVQNPRTAKPGTPADNIDHRIVYIDDAELQKLQNTHHFHLCPSETEGFGHYLAEAMAVGALTLTVDAPPMNELVTPDRGLLVAPEGTGTQHLATTHFFDKTGMERAIEHALSLDDTALQRFGMRARAWHQQNDHAFGSRLVRALEPLLEQGAPGANLHPVDASPLRASPGLTSLNRAPVNNAMTRKRAG